jgi:hypothetical protein
VSAGILKVLMSKRLTCTGHILTLHVEDKDIGVGIFMES